jgi:hypothetical protein
MKRWKKIALVLLGLALLSQAPFAYRRYRLGRLRAAIDAVNASRNAPATDDPFDEYKGVFHVHTLLGGHSEGTFDEVVAAARSNGLAFVVMTEHPSKHVDTAAATLNGVREGVLFVGGSELSAENGERVFVVPGPAPPPGGPAPPDARTLVERARAAGRLSVIAYPEQIRDWTGLDGADAVEVYNLYTNSKRISYGLLFFDGLWSYRSHADLLFATFYERPAENLMRWDELNAVGGRLAALGGNDAHSNVGLRLGDRAGGDLVRLKLDPYERSFRVVRNHVLVERGRALDAAALTDALRRGRSFIAFDLFGDSTGFRFSADGPAERGAMGDEIALPRGGGGVRLRVTTPVRSRVVFIRNGRAVHEAQDSESTELVVDEPGAWRVEVYLDQLGDLLGRDRPWIISNPVYVR